MPSDLHEGLIKIIKLVPDLLPDLLRETSQQDLPAYAKITGCSEAATITIPIEHRADAVRAFIDADNQPVLVAVVEVQLRPEATKPWVWPVYLTEARRESMCPAALMVIVPDARTAKWARNSLDLGLGLSFVTPVVVDISELSTPTDVESAAEDIGMTMLAILGSKAPQQAMDTLNVALSRTDREEAKKYADLMHSALRGAAKDYWRNLMATEEFTYQSDYAQELRDQGIDIGVAKGKAEGKAEGILEGEAKMLFTALHSRNIAIPDEARQRIESCQDSDMFRVWMTRTMAATTIDDVLNPPETGSAGSQ